MKRLTIWVGLIVFFAITLPAFGQQTAEEYFNKGVGLYEAQNYNEAVTAFEKAIEIKPDYAEAYYNLGITYWQQRQWEKVSEKLQKVMELAPGSDVAKKAEQDIKNLKTAGVYSVAPNEEEAKAEEETSPAKPSEKPMPLPTGHHEQVRLAVKHFEDAIQSELTANRKVTSKHTPAEQSALALLKTLSGFHLLSAEEQHLCRVAAEAVGKVKFQKLAGKLSALAKRHRKAPMPVADFIDRALAILKAYPLLEPSNPDLPEAPPVGITPDIIISESFA